MSAVRTKLAIGWLALVAACARPAAQRPLPPLPRETYARYLEGRLSGYRGDWERAAESLAAAAAASPDQPMIAVELARAQHKAKRTDAALATLAAARTRWPEHPQVWLVSGDLLAVRDAEEAKRAYLRAIQLAPDDERGYLGLAKLQSDQAAEATLRILIDHVPGSVDGRYRLALRLAARDELAAAAAELHAVLERDPDHIDARLDLARALRRLGRLDDAIAETRSAFDRSGQAIDIAEELFWLLCEADDDRGAVDLLTLLDDDRSDADALAVVARLHRGLGRLADARAVAARIAVIDRDAGALAGAEIDIAAGNFAAANTALAAITGKRALDARRLTAEAALAAGDPAAALAAVPRADRERSLASALVTAYALVDLDRRADADAALASHGGAEASAGEQRAVAMAHARIADRAGDAAAALAAVEPMIASRPDFLAALNLAGYLLADTGQRLADAERYLRRARDLAPGDPAILDSWGWLLLRQGKPRAAVRALDRAVRYAPLEPEIRVHLAAAWAADGAPRHAAEILGRAAALHPSRAVQKQIERQREALRQAVPPE